MPSAISLKRRPRWPEIRTLAGSGLVLLIRTVASPGRWREVWLGPDEVPEPWQVVQEARWQAEEDERALFDKDCETWDSLTTPEKDAASSRRDARLEATEARLTALQQQAEAAKAKEQAARRTWSVREIFWMATVFGAFGLVPLYWHLAFDWAMTWKMVKGREWVAGAAVILGGFCIAGAVISIFEEIDKVIRGRADGKKGSAGGG